MDRDFDDFTEIADFKVKSFGPGNNYVDAAKQCLCCGDDIPHIDIRPIGIGVFTYMLLQPGFTGNVISAGVDPNDDGT